MSDRSEPLAVGLQDILVGVDPGSLRPARLESSSMQGQRLLVKLSIAGDRSEAEALVGLRLYAERQQVKSLEADELHWFELEGAQVEDSDGVCLGLVDHVYNAGASDILVVADTHGRSVDIPLVGDYIDFAAWDAQSQMSGSVASKIGHAQPSGAALRTLRLKVVAATFDGLWQGEGR